jgi:transcriptional antiterminator RfaH
MPVVEFEEEQSRIILKREIMFPRYLFINHANNKNLYKVSNTRGVSNIVKFGGQYSFVPENVVQSLKLMTNKKGIIRRIIAKKKLSVGDRLIIESGPFKGLEGTLLSRKSKDRVIVLLNLLSKSVPVDIQAPQIR